MIMQPSIAQKEIDELIQAEKNFAAYAGKNGTKNAFLAFLDSAGVVFDKGNAVNGIAYWNNREKTTGVLNWHPLYAAISAMGDVGFTTGPWTYQATKDSQVVARGIYTTVWHRNNNNEWKFLVDLGVDSTPLINDTVLTVLPFTGKKSFIQSLLKAEEKYIAIAAIHASDCNKLLAEAAVLNRNGKLHEDGKKVSRTFPDKVKYNIQGSGIATSGDLGFVYGIAVVNGKSDNYLRIWVHENNGWKVIVEVLRY